MPVLDVEKLRAYSVPEYRESYDARDTILYALGTGAGLADVDELALVYERQLKALPTMALVLGTPGFWAMDPRAGLDWQQSSEAHTSELQSLMHNTYAVLCFKKK